MATRGKPIRHQGREGQAIVLIAFAMIGLLAFMVLAIDGSKYFDQHRVAQNAADASSLAGVYYAYKNTSAVYPDILKEINRVAELNNVPDSDASEALVDNDNTNLAGFWT